MILLHKMISRGDQVSLKVTPELYPQIEIVAASGKPVPKVWLDTYRQELTMQIRQVKQIGDVSYDEIKSFFDTGGNLTQSQSVDEWVLDYSN